MRTTIFENQFRYLPDELPEFQLINNEITHLIEYHIPYTGTFEYSRNDDARYHPHDYRKLILTEFENTELGTFVAKHAATKYQVYQYIDAMTGNINFKFIVKIPEEFHNWILLKWH